MAPHSPYFVCAPYDTMYDPRALAYPPQESPEERARKPDVYWQAAGDMGTLDAPEVELRNALAHYYGMVSLLDDQAARLLDYLRRRGLPDDIIVVYTSDHGDYAGEYGMWGKSCTLYDCLVRVPLIIAGPEGLVPRGRTLDGMIQNIDILPTLLDLLALPVPTNVHGLSLRLLWQDGASRAAAVSGRQVELSVMARTPRWKLIYTPGPAVQELYEVESDPGELRNRYGDLGTGAVVGQLRGRLLDWMLAHT
jgi:arylsulfatase A-like enzyme